MCGHFHKHWTLTFHQPQDESHIQNYFIPVQSTSHKITSRLLNHSSGHNTVNNKNMTKMVNNNDKHSQYLLFTYRSITFCKHKRQNNMHFVGLMETTKCLKSQTHLIHCYTTAHIFETINIPQVLNTGTYINQL